MLEDNTRQDVIWLLESELTGRERAGVMTSPRLSSLGCDRSRQLLAAQEKPGPGAPQEPVDFDDVPKAAKDDMTR